MVSAAKWLILFCLFLVSFALCANIASSLHHMYIYSVRGSGFSVDFLFPQYYLSVLCILIYSIICTHSTRWQFAVSSTLLVATAASFFIFIWLHTDGRLVLK